MKHLKKFNEKFDDEDDDYSSEYQEELDSLYDEGAQLIIQAANLLNDPEMENEDVNIVVDKLRDMNTEESIGLADEIADVEKQIGSIEFYVSQNVYY